jgi:hypothetical protein
MQNAPNPFQGTTRVRICLKTAGALSLAIYDNQGKKLSEYSNKFDKGWHSFAISTNGARLLFLKVSDSTTIKTIKLLSNSPGNEGEQISYEGQSGNSGKTLKSDNASTGFIFYLGNQLQYTAYIRGYRKSVLVDNPVSNKIYTFTMRPFVCGDSITIHHVTGDVAPVTKTVTYGTVTNIPGETSKCWITSNLGADHQAAAKDDSTEASAGWYWQFNRKQGYKHDGITRTPATLWIHSISENSDWTSANDPCYLELGNGWRIPTKTEWINVDAGGNWNDWNGPWDSALKMHAAGFLSWNYGSLINRGFEGDYWTGSQNTAFAGSYLYFDPASSNETTSSKGLGFTLRCIKD